MILTSATQTRSRRQINGRKVREPVPVHVSEVAFPQPPPLHRSSASSRVLGRASTSTSNGTMVVSIARSVTYDR